MASELGPHMKLLDSAIDALLARFGNAARLLANSSTRRASGCGCRQAV